MGSVNQTKKGMAGTLAAVILGIAGLVGQVRAEQVEVGGSIPLINNLIGYGNTSLDVSAAGAAVTVATFWVNNNSSEGWDIGFTYANGGAFVKMDSTYATGYAIDWTASTLVIGSGTLGTGATAPAVAPTIGGAGTAVTNTAGDNSVGPQSTATVDYEINVTASWAKPAAALAGMYVEKVTAVLTAAL